MNVSGLVERSRTSHLAGSQRTVAEQLPEPEQLVLLEPLPDVMVQNLLLRTSSEPPPRTGPMAQFPADALLPAFSGAPANRRLHDNAQTSARGARAPVSAPTVAT